MTRFPDVTIKAKPFDLCKKEEAIALDAMGTIYNDFGDKDKSSEYFFKSLKIYDQLNDKRGMAQASSRIGVSYYKQKNYQKALEYLFGADQQLQLE